MLAPENPVLTRRLGTLLIIIGLQSNNIHGWDRDDYHPRTEWLHSTDDSLRHIRHQTNPIGRTCIHSHRENRDYSRSRSAPYASRHIRSMRCTDSRNYLHQSI